MDRVSGLHAGLVKEWCHTWLVWPLRLFFECSVQECRAVGDRVAKWQLSGDGELCSLMHSTAGCAATHQMAGIAGAQLHHQHVDFVFPGEAVSARFCVLVEVFLVGQELSAELDSTSKQVVGHMLASTRCLLYVLCWLVHILMYVLCWSMHIGLCGTPQKFHTLTGQAHLCQSE